MEMDIVVVAATSLTEVEYRKVAEVHRHNNSEEFLHENLGALDTL